MELGMEFHPSNSDKIFLRKQGLSEIPGNKLYGNFLRISSVSVFSFLICYYHQDSFTNLEKDDKMYF